MKKILKMMTLILMVLALTGCVKLNVNVEVKSDKTMKMGMEMLVEETLVQSSGMTTEEYMEQLKDQFITNESFKQAKTTPISKTIDGTKWVGVNVESNSNAEDAKELLTEKEIDGKESIVLTLPMDDFQNEMDLESMGYSVSKMKAMGLEMNVNIEMPGDATTNFGKANGNKVTIDLLEMMSSGHTGDLVVSSPLSGGGMGLTIALIAVGAVVIAGAVFFMLKKKKPVEEAYVAPSMPQPPLEEPKSQEATVTETSTPQEENVEETVAETPAVQEESVEETVAETPVSQEEVQETQTTKEDQPQSEQKYCPNCGTPVSSEDTCPQCGYEIKK